VDADLAAPKHGARLDPGGVNVGDVEGVRELAIGAAAGMGDEIDLGKARDRDRPVIRLEGNVVLEQRAGFRPPIAAGAELAFQGRQPPINLPGADRAQLAAHGGGQAQPAPGPGQPRRPQRLQAYGPRVSRRLPDHPQRLDHRARIRRGPAPPARPRCARGRTVEEPQRVLAMVARRPTELIEDPPLARSWR